MNKLASNANSHEANYYASPICRHGSTQVTDIDQAVTSLIDRISSGEIPPREIEFTGSSSSNDHLLCTSRLRSQLPCGQLLTIIFEQKFSLDPERASNQIEVSGYIRDRSGNVRYLNINQSKIRKGTGSWLLS